MKALAIFDLVPGWCYAAALAVGLALLGVQTVRVAGLERDLALADAETARSERQRTAALLDHATEKLALIAKHNEATQLAEKTHAEKLAAAEVRARAESVTVSRLRKQIADYANRGGTCAPTAAEPDGRESPAQVLGGLLAESIELLAEGRRLHELRDAEVSLLLGQIDADRAACGAKRVTNLASP